MHDPTPGFPGPERLATLPQRQRVFLAFFRAMNLHRQLMARKLGEHDMHPGQAICLTMLAHRDGITQSDLADRLNVTRPTVTVMLQKMEKAGLIERRSDEHDQRYTRIHVTEAGTKLHDEMHGIMLGINEHTFGPLSEKDQRELERLLLLVGENMVAALGESGKPATSEGAAE